MKERLSFRAALIEVKAAEFDAIPDRLSFRPSLVFVRKMRALLRSRREQLLPPSRLSFKKAIVIAIVAAMIAALPLASGAVRQAIGGFFSEILDSIGASRYEVDDTGKEMHTRLETEYEISIPEGYAEYERTSRRRSLTVRYRNDENAEIVFSQDANPKFTITHDTENAIVEEIMLGDIVATYFEGKDYKDIMWTQDGYVFMIHSVDSILKEELIALALSCAPKS